mgnify:CR=1 FL=1
MVKALALVALALLASSASAFYLPGVAPQDFKKVRGGQNGGRAARGFEWQGHQIQSFASILPRPRPRARLPDPAERRDVP